MDRRVDPPRARRCIRGRVGEGPISADYVLRLGKTSWTLSFELAARLSIWGPPFAGEAFVDQGIVAFTIPIGDRSAARTPPRIWWPEFEATFLPAEPLAITLAGGLVAEGTGAPVHAARA